MSTEEPSLQEQIGALVHPQLLVLLERAFPLREALPTLTDSDRVIGKKIGERSVVDFLRACHETVETQQKVL